MGKFISRTITIGVVLCGICFITCNFYDAKNIEDTQTNKINQNNNMLSMMLETDSGSGQYEMTSLSSWPTDGYVFNSELSKCENGSKLSWDETNKQVVFSGIITDKCYVYFDVISSVALADYVISQYTGIQGENNIYYHDSNLTNGAGDNSYRYAGASDQVNNYVCFGSTQSPCPADNLYRIIGVFGDRVKLIKSDYATTALLGTDGDYSKMYTAEYQDNSNYKENNLANIAAYTWNYKNNTTINSRYGSNTWSTSLLNKTNLNQNFITNIGADWAAKIDMTTWKVGGNTWVNIGLQPASYTYQNEIVNPVTTNTTDNATEYSAKIGLMYVSDYGFAAAQDKWTLVGTNSDASKDYRAATSVNWMYMGLVEWTISRYADNTYSVFNVTEAGGVYYYSANRELAVRPVFYLKASVAYAGGSGTKDSPITLAD